MNPQNELHRIWNRQESNIPDATELHHRTDAYKSKQLKIQLIGIVSTLISAIVICLVWYFYQPVSFFTKAGIILVLVGIAMHVLYTLRIRPLLSNLGFELSSKQYLAQLTSIKKKQATQQGLIMNIYFFLLTLGLCLYMYEPASSMPNSWGIVAYVITLGWLGLNWFVFRPRIIKKQISKIDALIGEFNRISSQFD